MGLQRLRVDSLRIASSMKLRVISSSHSGFPRSSLIPFFARKGVALGLERRVRGQGTEQWRDVSAYCRCRFWGSDSRGPSANVIMPSITT